MGVPAGSESVGLGRETGLENGFKYHEQDLLNDPVRKARLLVLLVLELALGYGPGRGSVVGAPDEVVGLGGVPGVVSTNDSVSEGEEVAEEVGVDGAARRESAGDVGTAALVGEDPEVEFGKEAGEVGECGGGRRRREGLDPEIGAYFNWVLFEE